jgi:hypothetical protein
VVVRATGTFSYIGTASSFFVVMALIISLVVMLLKSWDLRLLLIWGMVYGADVLGAVFTGSRAPVGVIGILLTVTILLQGLTNQSFRQLSWRFRFRFLGAGIVLVLALCASGGNLVFMRFLQSGDFTERVAGAFAISSTAGVAVPWLHYLGGGIGLTHPGELTLLHKLYPNNPVSLTYYGESGKYRMTAEMGLIGYYLFLMLQLGTFAYCLRFVFNGTMTTERCAVAMVGIFVLLCTFLTLTSDYIMNMGFWFAIGCVLSIALLPQSKT